jgi:hypothetical protein
MICIKKSFLTGLLTAYKIKQIHDDIENIDIYFERIESLKCFVEKSYNQSQGG